MNTVFTWCYSCLFPYIETRRSLIELVLLSTEVLSMPANVLAQFDMKERVSRYLGKEVGIK